MNAKRPLQFRGPARNSGDASGSRLPKIEGRGTAVFLGGAKGRRGIGEEVGAIRAAETAILVFLTAMNYYNL
jgi:hypothetical protein